MKPQTTASSMHHRAASDPSDRVEWAVYRSATWTDRLGSFIAAPSAGLSSNLDECRAAFGEHVCIVRQSDGMRLDWY